MIGGDQERSPCRFDGCREPSYTIIHGSDGDFRRFENAGVSNHVGVGIIDQDEIISTIVDGTDEAVRQFMGRHLRLEVVGRYLGGRDQNAVFSLKRRFLATVEEECHMGVFLCLGNPQLLFACICDKPGEDIVQRYRREHCLHIRVMGG